MTGDWLYETARPGFTAGTPIETEYGSQAVETIKVWSRDEFGADAPAGLKVVEELFTRHAQVLRLHVGNAIIGTTAEHPFWVVGKGWVNANELTPGDTLIGKDGQEIAISQVEDTGEWATVYNMRVADWHTYFVGAAEWGFSVWAHNAPCTPAQQLAKNRVNGKAAEVLALAFYSALKGVQVVGTQIAVRTTKNLRYIDILLRVNGKLIAVEVKNGRAIRSAKQIAKDIAMRANGVRLPASLPGVGGQFHKIPTVVRRF